ncbi:hypothetical protein F4777DRAFT_557551 [Nemania sp. FL0916]|nr:hypothetical protein F4777DRAFT_557551 [Nemania sp. FL0916]
MEKAEPPQAEPPPSYAALEEQGATNDVIQPVILILAGRLIYSESAGPSSSSVLYELDHDVNYLSRADHKVEFSRHEARVRTSSGGGSAHTSTYQRHIYNLESPHALTSTSRYGFFLTAVSRKALGHVGLKKTTTTTSAGLPRSGFKVLRINSSGGGEDAELFEITRKEGRCEWWDTEGRRIAIEDAGERESGGLLKMILTTALPRQQADALVATWCLRLWHDAAMNEDASIFSGVKKKLGIRKWGLEWGYPGHTP